MDALEQRLATYSAIGLDTSIFIYHFEAHPDYLPLTTIILKGVQAGEWQGITSALTIMELTVPAWRLNRADIARQYEVLLANFPNLSLYDIDRDVARQAAQLRANYNLRPADALQVATAIVYGATAWVSNDKKLNRLTPVLEIVTLTDFLSTSA